MLVNFVYLLGIGLCLTGETISMEDERRPEGSVNRTPESNVVLMFPSNDSVCYNQTRYVTKVKYEDVRECKEVSNRKCFKESRTDYQQSKVTVCRESFKQDCNINYHYEIHPREIKICEEKEDPCDPDMEMCADIVETECKTIVMDTKNYMEEVECKPITKRICSKSNCKKGKKGTLCRNSTQSLIQEIPREKCKLIPIKNCQNETKLLPNIKQETVCQDIPSEVCVNLKKNPVRVKELEVKMICSSGSWSTYGEWSNCSAVCGIGFATRKRHCNGDNCVGKAIQSGICKTDKDCIRPSNLESPDGSNIVTSDLQTSDLISNNNSSSPSTTTQNGGNLLSTLDLDNLVSGDINSKPETLGSNGTDANLQELLNFISRLNSTAPNVSQGRPSLSQLNSTNGGPYIPTLSQLNSTGQLSLISFLNNTLLNSTQSQPSLAQLNSTEPIISILNSTLLQNGDFRPHLSHLNSTILELLGLNSTHPSSIGDDMAEIMSGILNATNAILINSTAQNHSLSNNTSENGNQKPPTGLFQNSTSSSQENNGESLKPGEMNSSIPIAGSDMDTATPNKNESSLTTGLNSGNANQGHKFTTAELDSMGITINSTKQPSNETNEFTTAELESLGITMNSTNQNGLAIITQETGDQNSINPDSNGSGGNATGNQTSMNTDSLSLNGSEGTGTGNQTSTNSMSSNSSEATTNQDLNNSGSNGMVSNSANTFCNTTNMMGATQDISSVGTIEPDATQDLSSVGTNEPGATQDLTSIGTNNITGVDDLPTSSLESNSNQSSSMIMTMVPSTGTDHVTVPILQALETDDENDECIIRGVRLLRASGSWQRVMNMMSLRDCKRICTNLKDCRFFTYIETPNSGKCILLSTAASFEANIQESSVSISGAADCILPQD